MNTRRAVALWPLLMGTLSLTLGSSQNTKPYFVCLLASFILMLAMGIWFSIERRPGTALVTAMSWLATTMTIAYYAGDMIVPVVPINVSFWMMTSGGILYVITTPRSQLELQGVHRGTRET